MKLDLFDNIFSVLLYNIKKTWQNFFQKTVNENFCEINNLLRIDGERWIPSPTCSQSRSLNRSLTLRHC